MAKKKATRKRPARKKAARKKTTRKKPTPKPRPPADDATIGQLVLLMVAGHQADAIRTQAAASFDLTPDQLAEAITEARRRLQLAAEYNRDEALGTAIKRLNSCYAQAAKDGDIKTAVVAQRELNRLMDIGPKDNGPDAAAQEADETLAAVVGHLDGLNLAAAGTAPDELVRLAVGEIMRHRATV